jgi:hypothetical protein
MAQSVPSLTLTAVAVVMSGTATGTEVLVMTPFTIVCDSPWPQHWTVPSFITAHARSVPTLTDLAVVMLLIWLPQFVTGVGAWPLPSWPTLLLPQHSIVVVALPTGATEQALLLPMLTEFPSALAFGVVTPLPQQNVLPVLLTEAHVPYWPALIEVALVIPTAIPTLV